MMTRWLSYWLMSSIFLALLGPPLAARAADKEVVTIRTAEDHVDFLVGKSLVGRYHIGKDVAKPYFWPVNGPDGTPITRGWPMIEAKEGETKDHPHQKSLWFCHGDVIPEGVEIKQKIRGIKGVDFWSEAKGHGLIVCTKARHDSRKKNDGQDDVLLTHNEWRTADGVNILDEDRGISLYLLGSARLLLFDIDLVASVAPLTFGDTKEGSMGVRINDAIREKGHHGKLVNADGATGMTKCWGRLSAWCDYSGAIDGKKLGIAIFDHPDNKPAACWHSRDYGLMAANPFGRAHSEFPAMKGNTDLFKLAKGEHLRLRYGVLIHSGDVKEGKVAEHYETFVKLAK